MDIRVLITELFEKLSLIATAGLLGVLVPPLRNRLLGVGRPRDIWVAVVFGLLLSLWGSTMGFAWLGHHLNLRAVGIMIAGILGGARAGALTGLLAGLFFVARVAPDAGVWALGASILDGWLAGRIAERKERWFVGWRAIRAAALIQLASLTIVALGIGVSGGNTVGALPSLGAQLLGVAAGVALWVNVARVVLAREEQAVALVAAQAAANELSLQALRSRLEPHFLFNALNTLRATIRTDPDRARGLVSDLADLYRYLLHHPRDASLDNEVEHACAYLAIERARLGEERLAVRTAIDENVRDTRVPALLLQPIVENAVKHGITPKDGVGTITIRARDLGDLVRIEVEDEADGPASHPPTKGSGLALTTLRKRLERQYNGNAALRLSPLERGTLVTVDLPKMPGDIGENA
ncbi:MAG: histidine kinase [Myxococcales bacterium]|nr:histidine kinase [Myxococcales bacterium]MDH3846105.1 histidine kinase [Myxococcales bacterium]